MNRPDWSRVEQVFGEAVELTGDARAAHLDSACGEDTGLRREVESLLAHTSGADDWGSAARHEAARLLGLEKLPEPGAQVGAWRLVRQLGSGGMGSVFEAQRADGLYDQRVALKILHPEHSARGSVLARFQRERQILARLDHPNIARLIDGGITPAGLPYLVMEFVDGLPVDEFVRKSNASAAQTAQLMESVLAAVQSAHRNLVLHRDLKPGNILVTAEGTPKLLDFGIGKILDNAGLADSSRTQAFERALTPDYASPEQIRGEAITTATDIYSAGAVLYELLAGRRAYEVKTTSLLEMEKSILEAEPRAPSLEEGGALAAAGREAAADLDAIVQKAMRKTPADRYESAGAMAADLRRFREGYPVEARKGSRRYAVKKLLRRHARAVVAATVFLCLLTTFAAGMAVLAGKLAIERDTARRERVRAERVSDYLLGIFRGADPHRAQGEVLSARELLDEGASRIDNDLAAEPVAREQVLNTMAQAYQHLGLFDRASALFERRTRAVEQAYGASSPQMVNALRQWGDTERQRSRLEEAEKLLRRAKALLDGIGGAVTPERAHLLNNLGLVLQARGQFVEAEKLFREAVGIAAGFKGEENELLTMRSNLGGALGELGRWEEAETELRYALDERRRRLGDRHPQVIRSLSRLGRLLMRRLDAARAEPLFRESLGKALVVLGPEHLDTLNARVLLGTAMLELGTPKEAARLIEDSIRTGVKVLGSGHLDVLGWQVSLAEAWSAEGRKKDAQLLAQQTAGELEEKLGPHHPRVVRARNAVDDAAKNK